MLLVMVLSALGLASPFAPAVAQDKKDPPPKEKPAPSLKEGDVAPALKVTKWLQGDAVTKFEPGKIYVIEFWATWCPSCVRHMPQMSELQAQYKDKGLTVISFTSQDIHGQPGNTGEKVAAFVKKQGPKLKYTFAYAGDAAAADAWIEGQESFPVFVVDKAGRIAYIGSPLFLEMVLPKVVDGSASAKVIGDEMAKVVADYRTVCTILDRDGDHEGFLRALTEFEKKYPSLAESLSLPAFVAKLGVLLQKGTVRQQEEYAEPLVAKAIKQNNVFMLEMAHFLLHEKKESKALLALAVRAAEALVRIDGGKDARSLLRLADAYFISDDKTKAKEYARRAVEAAAGESPTVREEIEKEARRLGGE
jgi:thiol-disulfide isomerase/thioredoxin